MALSALTNLNHHILISAKMYALIINSFSTDKYLMCNICVAYFFGQK